MPKYQSPIGRTAYPNLATPRKPNPAAEERYSTTLVFAPSISLDSMKVAVDACVKEAHPNGPPANFRYPFRSGSDKIDQETGLQKEGFNADDVFCEFWKHAKRGAVGVVDADRNPIPAADVYAGCEGRVIYHPFCYNKNGNIGCGLSLDAYQFIRDGDPIGYAPVDATTAFTEDAGSVTPNDLLS